MRPMKQQAMRTIYAPTVLAVAVLIAAISVVAGDWLLFGVLCVLGAGLRLSYLHPFGRHKKLP